MHGGKHKRFTSPHPTRNVLLCGWTKRAENPGRKKRTPRARIRVTDSRLSVSPPAIFEKKDGRLKTPTKARFHNKSNADYIERHLQAGKLLRTTGLVRCVAKRGVNCKRSTHGTHTRAPWLVTFSPKNSTHISSQVKPTHLRSFQAEDRALADATGSPVPGTFGGTRAAMSAEAASPSLESLLPRSARWSAMEQPQTRPSSREVDARRLAPWSPVQATSPVHGIHVMRRRREAGWGVKAKIMTRGGAGKPASRDFKSRRQQRGNTYLHCSLALVAPAGTAKCVLQGLRCNHHANSTLFGCRVILTMRAGRKKIRPAR